MKLSTAIMLTAGLMTGAQAALANSELRDRASTMFSAVPKYPPVIDGNELTAAKVELGKMLFFEPRLSSSHLISCNTCHNVGMGGHDYLPTSIGHGWQKGGSVYCSGCAGITLETSLIANSTAETVSLKFNSPQLTHCVW